MKRVASDGWFQMFAAIAGLAAVVTLLGRVNTRPVAAPAASPVPAQAAAPQPNVSLGAQPPAAAPEADRFSLPAQGSSVDLAVPPAAAAPAAAPAPADPPRMTLTGAGVGNAQGMPAAPQAGGVAGFFGGLLGGIQPGLAALPPANFVKSAKPGVFVVDANGGADTTSVRDAVFSAADGDEIQVRPGKYDGNVDVSGKSVKIKGLGGAAGDVVLSHTGRSATVAVRGGSLTLEKVRVIYGGSNEFPPREPHAALFVTGGSVIVRKSELGFPGAGESALMADRADKPTSIIVEDSELAGGRATAVLRGALRARFVRSRLNGRQPVAAWLEASVELADCKFDSDPATTLAAWEGALAAATGAGRPRVSTTRGAEATVIEGLFGSGTAAGPRRGFSRDIFRRGRQPGSIP